MPSDDLRSLLTDILDSQSEQTSALGEIARDVADLRTEVSGAVRAFVESVARIESTMTDEAAERRRMHANIDAALVVMRGAAKRVTAVEERIEALEVHAAMGH